MQEPIAKLYLCQFIIFYRMRCIKITIHLQSHKKSYHIKTPDACDEHPSPFS
jgi:hypothetical protein